MGDLTSWARDQSPYLKLKDGESINALFCGFKVIEDTFNPGKQKVRYQLEIDGKKKYFDSSSTRVAMAFDAFEEGALITITAHGEGVSRKYEVEEAK